MANDRIWAACKQCGEAILVITYFPGESRVFPTSEALHAFFTAHARCVQERCWGHSLGADPCFTFVTDDTPMRIKDGKRFLDALEVLYQ